MQESEYKAPPMPYRAVLGEPPPKQPAVVYLKDYQSGQLTPFAAKGSLTLIITQTGIGKSTVCQHICMAAAKKEGIVADTLGFEVKAGSGSVYYADMEMSHGQFYDKFEYMAHKAGYTDKDDFDQNSRVIWDNYVHGLDAEQNRECLQNAVNLIEELDLVILDDIAHFVDDPNDYTQYKSLIKMLKSLFLTEFPCAVIATIHANPGSSKTAREKKARGHLGTNLHFFATNAATIVHDQDTGVKTISTDKEHYDFCKARLGATASWHYKFDEGARQFASCEPPEHGGGNSGEQLISWSSLFDGAAEMKAKDLINTVSFDMGVSTRTAESRIKDAVERGELVKVKQGVYRLAF